MVAQVAQVVAEALGAEKVPQGETWVTQPHQRGLHDW